MNKIDESNAPLNNSGRRYGHSDAIICKQLVNLLVMNTLIKGDSFDLPNLFIDRTNPDNWTTVESGEKVFPWDLVGAIDKINITDVRAFLKKQSILPSQNTDDVLTEETPL
jgi:hypothetical protein